MHLCRSTCSSDSMAEMADDTTQLPLVVIDLHQANSVNTVVSVCDRLTQTQNYRGRLVIWNSTGETCELNTELILTISSQWRFLSSRQDGEKLIASHAAPCVMVVDGGLEISLKHVELLTEKFIEYGRAMAVCTHGLRLFPHHPYSDPTGFWRENRYIQYHGPEDTDREVHLVLLDGGCCLFPAKSLLKALTPGFATSEKVNLALTGDFQVSLAIQKKTLTHIWKVEIDLPEGTTCPYPRLKFSEETIPELVELYRIMRSIDCPQGMFSPVVPKQRANPRDKATVWQKGFQGLNMSAEPVHLDFEAAKAYGASVVRFGAVNDARDLAFLVNDRDGDTTESDREHLERALPRLRRAVQLSGESGLKVILTLCDLPGRRFRDSEDDRIWRSVECRQRIADLWGAIAEGLGDLRDIIVGYDVINEPFTPEDKDLSFDCPMSSAFVDELNDLYARALKAIRAVDKETMLIVESSFWASPRTIPFISLIDDPFIAYSFHFYAPNIYTFRHSNDGRYSYPGKVPKWKNDTWTNEWPIWDEKMIREVIEPVAKWQKENGVDPSRIFVGEFGVSREVPGAERYLADVIHVWEDLGWSWCVFSFRDNEWDAMDYELGCDRRNQLQRHQTNLFKLIAKHLS